jgi:hypothetical protein
LGQSGNGWIPEHEERHDAFHGDRQGEQGFGSRQDAVGGLLGAMAKFNEEMVKAGVMIDGAGLQASSKGARIRFSGDKRSVVQGPFPETASLIAGYWIINVKSKDEAIEWMMRCPNPHEEDGDIEIRQMSEMEDFGDSPAVEHHKANQA